MAKNIQIKLTHEEGTNICEITLPSGERKALPISKLGDRELEELVKEDSLEESKCKIDGDLCIINLLASDGQWGRTIVWNYTLDRLLHLTSTPYVQESRVQDGKVLNRCLVQYWGHPADWWHSEAPLELCDVSFEPELVLDENQGEGN